MQARAALAVQCGTDALCLVAMLPPAAAAGFTFGLAVVRPRTFTRLSVRGRLL